MTDETPAARALSKEKIFDERTSLVKEIVAKHNTARDERTVKLRELRLAQQTPTIAASTQKPTVR